MRETLRQRCALFMENKNAIRAAFGWESIYIYPLCASICTCAGMRADAGRIRACLDLLKQKAGAFSNFRGISKLATVTMLSLCPDPAQQLDQMLAVYNNLKMLFWGSEYLAITAAVIVQLAQPQQYAQIVQKTRAVYDWMKNAHPFLTSGEDSVFAALLALSKLDDVQVMREAERCDMLLRPVFFSRNAVQSLGFVLALGDAPAEQKCQRVFDLFGALKAQGRKYGAYYELATLGALALLNTDITVLAEDMIAVDVYLSGQKGFGAFGVGARQRLMYAGLLTMCDYAPYVETMQIAVLSSVVAQVIAQQAATSVAIAASST